MNYERFVATLNHHIFQLEREKLLRKLVNEPERFLGLFRPSKPKGKLFQHLLQAREIGFGDALEEIVAGWLEHYGYQRLDNRIRVNGETMECDHYALSPNQDFGLLIEQKVRDDHDSSKKYSRCSAITCRMSSFNSSTLISATVFMACITHQVFCGASWVVEVQLCAMAHPSSGTRQCKVHIAGCSFECNSTMPTLQLPLQCLGSLAKTLPLVLL